MITRQRIVQALLIIIILLLQVILPTVNAIAVEANLVTIQFNDINMYNAMVEALDDREISSKDDSNLTIKMTQDNIDRVLSLNLYQENSLNKIEDITGIEYFTNLEELKIREWGINNIDKLSGLTKLKYLYLEYNEISDISPLATLTNLELLSLNKNNITDITTIEELTNLKALFLNYNKITNIESLSKVMNLEELTLCNNTISDITSLQNLTNLYRLELNNNEISNIEVLSNLTELYMLNLQGNNISNIDALSSLTNLGKKFFGELDLGWNDIEDISPLANLTELTRLNLENNKIKDISVLSNLEKLNSLNLSYNRIQDAEAIYSINPQYLDLNNQNLEITTHERIIMLPRIFIQAKDSERDILYTEQNFILENCELNEDGTKLIINANTDKASITIKGGKLYDTKLILNIGEPEPKTEFILGRDNNSFVHTNSSDFDAAGFIGVTNYQIPQEYFDVITQNSTDGQKDAVIAREHREWGGSCYGIAAMMGLAYYNRINLEDIQAGVTNFFDLDYPYKQEELLNLIQSYYLMQVSGEKIDYEYMKPFLFGLIKDPENDYDNLNSFLEDLVNTTKQEIVQLGYGTSKGGHEILACGSEQLEDGTYRVKLYDMNSVRDDNSGQFKYMTISSDFSEFSIENDLGGKPMNNKNYRYIRFRKFSDYKIITEDNNGLVLKASSAQQENELVILFDAVSNFTIKNSKNETLTYDGENLSGNMEVRDVNFVANGEDNQEIIVKVPYSEELTYEEQGEQTDISVYDNDNYMSVEGSNIDNVEIDLDEDVKVKGTEPKVKVQIDNKNDGLYEINANVQNEVEVKRQDENIKVSSDETIENVTVNELTVEEKSELANSVEAKNVNIDGNGNVTSYDELLKGDASGDGKVDFKDILLINKHRLNKTQLTGIYLEAADVNGDGKVEFMDILKINKYRLGKISSL